jgi:hypothetical protein
MSTVDQWWYEVLRGERSPDGIFGVETLKDSVYGDYKTWCIDNGRRADSSPSFWKNLRSRVGAGFKAKRGRQGKKRKREVWLPSRDECQAEFAKAVNCEWSILEAL